MRSVQIADHYVAPRLDEVYEPVAFVNETPGVLRFLDHSVPVSWSFILGK